MTRRTNKQTNTRARIAAAAARLMAEDGIDDFALAKRKAAKQLGVLESQARELLQEFFRGKRQAL